MRKSFFVLIALLVSAIFLPNVFSKQQVHILLNDVSKRKFAFENQKKAIEEVRQVLAKYNFEPSFYFSKKYFFKHQKSVQVVLGEETKQFKEKFEAINKEGFASFPLFFYEKGAEEPKKQVVTQKATKVEAKKVEKKTKQPEKEKAVVKEGAKVPGKIKKLKILIWGSFTPKPLFIEKLENALKKNNIDPIFTFRKDLDLGSGKSEEQAARLSDNTYDVCIYHHSTSTTRFVDENKGIMDVLKSKMKTKSAIYVHSIHSKQLAEKAPGYLIKIRETEPAFSTGIFLGLSQEEKNDFVFPFNLFLDSDAILFDPKYKTMKIGFPGNEYHEKTLKEYTESEMNGLAKLLAKVAKEKD